MTDPAKYVNKSSCTIPELAVVLSEFFEVNSHPTKVSIINGSHSERLLLGHNGSHTRIRQTKPGIFYLDDKVTPKGGKLRGSEGYFLGRFPEQFRDYLWRLIPDFGISENHVLPDSLAYEYPKFVQRDGNTGPFVVDLGDGKTLSIEMRNERFYMETEHSILLSRSPLFVEMEKTLVNIRRRPVLRKGIYQD